MSVRILVVEDHPIVVSGLVATLGGVDWIEAVEHAGTVAGARAALATTACDVVLLDLRLPDGSGMELLEASAAQDEGPAFLVLSSFMTPEYVAATLTLGAGGFLLKTASSNEILDAIRVVADGRLAYTAEQLRAARGAAWAPLTPGSTASSRASRQGGPTTSLRLTSACRARRSKSTSHACSSGSAS